MNEDVQGCVAIPLIIFGVLLLLPAACTVYFGAGLHIGSLAGIGFFSGLCGVVAILIGVGLLKGPPRS